VTETPFYRRVQRGLQGQDIREIGDPENGIEVKVATAEPSAILQAALEAKGRRRIQVFFRILDSAAEAGQQGQTFGRPFPDDFSGLAVGIPQTHLEPRSIAVPSRE